MAPVPEVPKHAPLLHAQAHPPVLQPRRPRRPGKECPAAGAVPVRPGRPPGGRTRLAPCGSTVCEYDWPACGLLDGRSIRTGRVCGIDENRAMICAPPFHGVVECKPCGGPANTE